MANATEDQVFKWHYRLDIVTGAPERLTTFGVRTLS
jgi:hypothetical protein